MIVCAVCVFFAAGYYVTMRAWMVPRSRRLAAGSRRWTWWTRGVAGGGPEREEAGEGDGVRGGVPPRGDGKKRKA